MTPPRAKDIAYVRFQVPDLDAAEKWLSDFGLARASRTEDALCMKGGNGAPFAWVAHKGEARFLGLGFDMGDDAMLDALAAKTGVAPATNAELGGGKIIRLTDPDGFTIEAVLRPHGAPETLPPRQKLNDAREKARLNTQSAPPNGPASVWRLGHAVVNVTDFRKSEAWYKTHFGLITSDEIELAPGATLGAFLRCDQGTRPVDHHTLFLVGTGKPGFNHAAFEVTDADALLSGHHVMKEKGHNHAWGIGRHILGSQIFDYWRDPFGFTLEHWTDGDLFSADHAPSKQSLEQLIGTRWGPTAPAHMA
ncbi:MAG TPA: VOC family protein [Micropepsaceae bacterium]|nr:VOC family protein [Micropepsaceae bacterium]